ATGLLMEFNVYEFVAGIMTILVCLLAAGGMVAWGVHRFREAMAQFLRPIPLSIVGATLGVALLTSALAIVGAINDSVDGVLLSQVGFFWVLILAALVAAPGVAV